MSIQCAEVNCPTQPHDAQQAAICMVMKRVDWTLDRRRPASGAESYQDFEILSEKDILNLPYVCNNTKLLEERTTRRTNKLF